MESPRKVLWSLLVLSACVAGEIPRRLGWGSDSAVGGAVDDRPWLVP